MEKEIVMMLNMVREFLKRKDGIEWGTGGGDGGLTIISAVERSICDFN